MNTNNLNTDNWMYENNDIRHDAADIRHDAVAEVAASPHASGHRATFNVWDWLVVLGLFLLRIPYLLIHHIQEDAFITFRTALHLAYNGQLSYNLGQHFPATTSMLYPLLLAGLARISGDHFILVAQLLATAAVIFGSYLVARCFAATLWERRLFWILLGSWPVSLVVSYTGMETPFLLAAFGMTIFAMRHPNRVWLFCSGIALLPLIRPDAVAYAVVFCAAMFLIQRRTALLGSASLTASLLLLTVFYRWTSGSYLPTTMSAKLNAYRPSHTPAAVLGRVFDLLFRHSFLLPVSTTYIDRFAPLMFLALCVGLYLALRRARSKTERVAIAAMAAVALMVPLAYGWGGVLFDWYLYPPNWLALVVILVGTVPLLVERRSRVIGISLTGVLWLSFAGIQWARSLAASTQDFHYRADIGRFLQDVAHGRGRLFLEPAGYIPYYSGLWTADEVGLVAPDVTPYIQHDRGHWWIDYVKDRRPDYIVERESFAHYQTFDGQTLTPAQQAWFNGHYRLIRRTSYNPALYHPSPILQRILRMGPMPDYLVFEKRGQTPDRVP